MIRNLKPYPEYKSSGVPWLKQIPVYWEVRPGFAAYREKQQKNIGMVERRVLSLSYGRIIVKPEEKLHGLVPESFETYQIVDPGDIVIRCTDLQNDHESLRVGLVHERGIITSAYMCLGMVGPLSPEYAYQQLNALDLMKVFYGMGSGLRQNLDFSDFKRLPIVVPPQEDQLAINRFLDHVDRCIQRFVAAKRRLLVLLNEQKQAIIQKAVTRGLDPSVRLKPSGVEWLGDVPAHWEPVQVRRLVSLVTSGSRGWAQYYSETGYVFLQSGNLGRAMALDLAYVQHVSPPDDSEGVRTRVRMNDVLVCITGALTGNVALVDVDLPEAYVNQHVALVRPSADRVDPRFLAYVLHSGIGRVQFKTSEYGGTKQGLGLNDVKGVFLALPAMAEQRAIVRDLDARVSNLAAPIARAQREIELVREFRNRLISDVVTGKLDVRCIELPDFEQGEEIFLSGDQSSVETPEEEEESVSESVEESTHAD